MLGQLYSSRGRRGHEHESTVFCDNTCETHIINVMLLLSQGLLSMIIANLTPNNEEKWRSHKSD